jgi:epoxyqueuosine reductase QueG
MTSHERELIEAARGVLQFQRRRVIDSNGREKYICYGCGALSDDTCAPACPWQRLEHASDDMLRTAYQQDPIIVEKNT